MNWAWDIFCGMLVVGALVAVGAVLMVALVYFVFLVFCIRDKMNESLTRRVGRWGEGMER